jgi:hypothetical protein
MSATDTLLYVDGVLALDFGVGQNEPLTSTNPIQLNGNRGGLSVVQYVGLVAEPAISQAAFSAAWIATRWANMNTPAAFYSIGVSQSGGPPPQTTPVIGNPSGTVTHTAGALTAGEPVFGNGGADIKVGTLQGNTTKVQAASGAAGAAGVPLVYDGSGNAVAGLAGELVPSGGTTGQVLTKNSNTNYDVSWQTNDDDIQINGATSLNIIQVNATQVWIGQTEIQLNGTFI